MSLDVLGRPARASRGKRLSQLLNEDAEADDEFWNQEAFREDAEDNEYETENEEADIFDSDFDEDEPEEENFEENERSPTKKRKKPPGKPVHHEKKKKEKKSYSTVREVISTVKVPTSDPSQSIIDLTEPDTQHREGGESILDPDGERSVRKSTRTSVIIKQAEREAHQAALQALSKPVKRKKEEERKISQEEMLLEAAQTEIQNLQALEIMLAREEEVKRKATLQRTVYSGPQIRFHSRDGRNRLEFTGEFPDIFDSSLTPYPKTVLCVITGQPAKYRDPKSDLPYATKEAFKIIRERYFKGQDASKKNPLEESHQRKRTKVERDRVGYGGRKGIIKLKFKKVTGISSSDNLGSISHEDTPPALLERIESEVQNHPRSIDPTLQTPIDQASNFISITSKDNISSLPLPGNYATSEFVLPDMPGSFMEANEADFMLDDLEVTLPSHLGTSLPPSGSLSISHSFLPQDSQSDMCGDIMLPELDSLVSDPKDIL